MDCGEKIQSAICNLKGTSIAHLEPYRDHVPVKTMAKVSGLFHWEWPINGDYAGFIQGRPLPHIGEWVRFSPIDINKLVERPIHKPTPNVETHSQPRIAWTMPYLKKKGKINISNYLRSIFNNHNIFLF